MKYHYKEELPPAMYRKGLRRMLEIRLKDWIFCALEFCKKPLNNPENFGNSIKR